MGDKSTAQRVEEHGSQARRRLLPCFKKAGVTYPPDRIVLVGLKDESVLEAWACSENNDLRHIRDFDILGQSGQAGPKLLEGDRQVPEGIYKIELLNPNSKYHLSLRIDYPNDFDRERAIIDGRDNLGGEIMIHGSDVSVGCLPIGDEGIEDMFVMAAETGIENITVILSPIDFRKRDMGEMQRDLPEWTDILYEQISCELNKLIRNQESP